MKPLSIAIYHINSYTQKGKRKLCSLYQVFVFGNIDGHLAATNLQLTNTPKYLVVIIQYNLLKIH